MEILIERNDLGKRRYKEKQQSRHEKQILIGVTEEM